MISRASIVIPAQAGIQPHGRLLWIPGLRSATPGMTEGGGHHSHKDHPQIFWRK